MTLANRMPPQGGLVWALVMLLMPVGCAPAPETGDGGTAAYLRFADQDDVPTLDPALGYDVASWQLEELLFNTLLDYDEAGGFVPELALRWEVSPDNRTYTFHLRTEARFTNGRPVGAADVRYAIERVLNPRTQSPGAEFFRGITGAGACTAERCSVAGIEVLAPHTLRVRLDTVDPLFLHKLAMPFAAAVPEEEVLRWGDDFARHPVGSGAFRLAEWVPGQRLLFVRNPDYFEPGVPRLAGVLRLVGVNNELAWLKYESGQLDVANIPPAEFPRVVHAAKYRPLLHQVTTLRTQYLGMNSNIPPFGDRRVRQALNYAANKPKLLRLINDRGVVAKGVLPPNMPGYNAALPGYPFDPQRARQLLAEAGYADGFATTLWVRSNEDSVRLAQSLQQDFAEVNVSVRIKPLAWGPFLEAVRAARDVPMFLVGWEADFPDPSNFLDVLLHSKHIGTNNNTNYRNPEVDARLDAAARTLDPEARLALLQQAEAVAVDDPPWVFLYHPISYQVVHPRLRDYRLHPLRPPRFDRVYLDGGR